MEISKTQLSNFASLAGLIVLILAKFGITIGADEVMFILGAVWTLSWTAYNFIQRYKKGDISLVGVKK